MRSTILPRRVHPGVVTQGSLRFCYGRDAAVRPLEVLPLWVCVADGPEKPPCSAAMTGAVVIRAIMAVIAANFFIFISPFNVVSRVHLTG